jgi:hypothetical protein
LLPHDIARGREGWCVAAPELRCRGWEETDNCIRLEAHRDRRRGEFSWSMFLVVGLTFVSGFAAEMQSRRWPGFEVHTQRPVGARSRARTLQAANSVATSPRLCSAWSAATYLQVGPPGTQVRPCRATRPYFRPHSRIVGPSFVKSAPARRSDAASSTNSQRPLPAAGDPTTRPRSPRKSDRGASEDYFNYKPHPYGKPSVQAVNSPKPPKAGVDCDELLSNFDALSLGRADAISHYSIHHFSAEHQPCARHYLIPRCL